MTDALRDRLYRRLQEGAQRVKVEEIAAIRAALDGHRYSTTPREREAFRTLFAYIDAQAQRIAQLEAALRPFVAVWDAIGPSSYAPYADDEPWYSAAGVNVTFGDNRRAAALLPNPVTHGAAHDAK